MRVRYHDGFEPTENTKSRSRRMLPSGARKPSSLLAERCRTRARWLTLRSLRQLPSALQSRNAHARSAELIPSARIDTLVFVLAQLLEALAHAVVLRRPSSLPLTAAKQEALRAVLG